MNRRWFLSVLGFVGGVGVGKVQVQGGQAQRGQPPSGRGAEGLAPSGGSVPSGQGLPPAQVQQDMPPAPPPVQIVRCPNCGREEVYRWITPLMKLVQDKDKPGVVNVEGIDPAKVLQICECKECGTMYGMSNAGKRKG